MIESEIKNARSALDYLPEYKILEDIYKSNDEFFMKVSIKIAGLKNEFIPEVSYWYIYIPEDYNIIFYPANEQSLTVTFKHQEFNAELPEKPYRAGYPCLHAPLHSIVDGYAIKGNPFEKFLAYSKRMLEWLYDAANDRLYQNGQPFEVPTNEFKSEFIFKGCDVKQWGYFDYKCGFAAVDKIYNKFILRTICDPKREEYNTRVYWGDISKQFERITEFAIWIKLNEFPIRKPWMYPQTWEELFSICKRQGIDVADQVLKLLALNDYSKISFLFFVFPIPKIYGGVADYYYWIMCELPSFGNLPNGFRKSNKGRSNFYKIKLTGNINWYKPKNWDNLNLLSRGAMDVKLQSLKFAVIGAGAVGSVVLEELSRIGVRHITVFDGDQFADGNIARHTLSLKFSGLEKSKAIKFKLAENNPNIQIKDMSFLGEANIELLKNTDVIIDCTASNEVLTLLKNKYFSQEKRYFIGAISYGAKDLIVYSNKGTNIDSELYLEITAPFFNNRTKEVTYNNMIMDGIGCYNPVFPARCDDIYILASIFVKQIVSELEKDFVGKKIIKYTIEDDISITRKEIYEERIL